MLTTRLRLNELFYGIQWGTITCRLQDWFNHLSAVFVSSFHLSSNNQAFSSTVGSAILWYAKNVSTSFPSFSSFHSRPNQLAAGVKLGLSEQKVRMLTTIPSHCRILWVVDVFWLIIWSTFYRMAKKGNFIVVSIFHHRQFNLIWACGFAFCSCVAQLI